MKNTKLDNNNLTTSVTSQSRSFLLKQDPLHNKQLFPYTVRPRAKGKFIYIGDDKFLVRGVTYGTFRPNEDGTQYPAPEIVDRDFAAIAAHNMNTVRTYTVPPAWLLDIAGEHGLRIMVGIPWEQHIAFLDEKERIRTIKKRVYEAVQISAQHPAILCFAIGNEIPSSIVRWYGRRRIEWFLADLYNVAKSAHPESLVTYVNYPTTEYLQLPFLDLVCFNVYLEERESFESYMARLHNIAGERPLLMAEIGLDSLRNGEDAQAASLAWQVQSAFSSGCAGAFVYAWTDEWHRGGEDIEDWDFGLTTRDRRPKPSLFAVRNAFTEIPFSHTIAWPKISVIVCSFNGSRTIRDTMRGIEALDYPEYEVICVNDGSKDSTEEIAREFGVHLITTGNQGLSTARNIGWQAAAGEIVAFIDDDAYPDPQWLRYIAYTFLATSYAGVGGPNISPQDSGPVATCIAHAPGGPIHVLLSDQEAEHIAGCNMAFRKNALLAIGGFDPCFRVAGDDVDICWMLHRHGFKIGFNPAAVVWHRRRPSIKAYWKQQKGYGKAEALLERKWPEKYTATGHINWNGRLYGKGLTKPLLKGKWRLYQGMWGTAPFQSLYQPLSNSIFSITLMPEWYFVILILAFLSAAGVLWPPLLFTVPLCMAAIAVPVIQSAVSAYHASLNSRSYSASDRFKLRALIAFLHLLQPCARLSGRFNHGLTPWRRRGVRLPAFPGRHLSRVWKERWAESSERVREIKAALQSHGAIIRHGGEYDHWDLEIRGGLFGCLRVYVAIEEHRDGKQMILLRSKPKAFLPPLFVTGVFAVLSILALIDQAWIASTLLGSITALLITRIMGDLSSATSTYLRAVKQVKAGDS
jgi:glycosyltransferase involved in cell wall biosynthesis